MIEVDRERCNGCGACAEACPFDAVEMDQEGKAKILEGCTACGSCQEACPTGAINIDREGRPMEGHRGIWVWAEWSVDGGEYRLRPVVLELLGKARSLARNTGEEVSAVLAGPSGMGSMIERCQEHADRVYHLEHPLLEEYSSDGYAKVISDLIRERSPSVVLYGATVKGRELAPRIAARLGVGLTADCTELTLDDEGQLVQTRPAFGGNVMASIVSPTARPQMATVRPRVMKAPDPLEARGKVIEPFVSLREGDIRVWTEATGKSEGVEASIEEAEILVSVGRGIQDQFNLERAYELAHLLGGKVSSSRALVERGWMPHARQVGQSGKTVNPRVYIALGISGAVQHLVGMGSSDLVVAVNKDPDAPIFRVADLGIVGDVSEILPALIDLLKGQR